MEWMLMYPYLSPLQSVRAVETRARHPLVVVKQNILTLAGELWKAEVMSRLFLLGPWLEFKAAWRANTQQGQVTCVWGQRWEWWGGDGQVLPKKKLQTVVRSLLLSTAYLLMLCAVCVRNVWSRNSWQTWQTISWTKQERRVNIPDFTNISNVRTLYM